jgi:microcompartment protein CcmK/EutM
MFLCQVTGSVVATRKQEAFRPAKLLVVHPVDEHGRLRDDAQEMLALAPRFGAGVGDYVLVTYEGGAVADIMESKSVSANVIIVGVVDDWSYEEGSAF